VPAGECGRALAKPRPGAREAGKPQGFRPKGGATVGSRDAAKAAPPNPLGGSRGLPRPHEAGTVGNGSPDEAAGRWLSHAREPRAAIPRPQRVSLVPRPNGVLGRLCGPSLPFCAYGFPFCTTSPSLPTSAPHGMNPVLGLAAAPLLFIYESATSLLGFHRGWRALPHRGWCHLQQLGRTRCWLRCTSSLPPIYIEQKRVEGRMAANRPAMGIPAERRGLAVSRSGVGHGAPPQHLSRPHGSPGGFGGFTTPPHISHEPRIGGTESASQVGKAACRENG